MAWRGLEFLQLPTNPYPWADKSAPAREPRFYRAVVFPAPTNMVFILPGTFLMGSPTNEVGRHDNEGPQTAVTISKGFWIGKYEVTQAEYLAVAGNNPSTFSRGANLPVETVSWFDATNYCAELTQRERAAGRILTNSIYRLPTEAEWEYACRAGTSTRFSYGDDPEYTSLTDYAWYFGNRSDTYAPVGQKLPNPWGLYDMYGNVWEWCQDWYDTYPGGIAVDPQGPVTSSLAYAEYSTELGVVRGGAVGFGGGDLRSASRDFRKRSAKGNAGFRVVLAAAVTPTSLPPLKVIRFNFNDTLIISWPASVSGAVLESAASFPAAAWTPVPIPPVVIGDQNAVTVDIEGRARFYWLRKP